MPKRARSPEAEEQDGTVPMLERLALDDEVREIRRKMRVRLREVGRWRGTS
jgi:hypothetical protein